MKYLEGQENSKLAATGITNPYGLMASIATHQHLLAPITLEGRLLMG